MIRAAVRGGWAALERAFWPLVLGSMALLVPDLLVSALRWGSGGVKSLPRSQVVAMVLVLIIARVIARCILRPGYLTLQAAAVRGQPADLRLITSRGSRAVSLLGAEVLRGVVVVVSAIVAASPALLLAAIGRSRGWPPIVLLPVIVLGFAGYLFGATSLVLTEWTVSLEELGPVAAIRETWGRCRPWRKQLFGVYVVVSLVELAGVVVGLFLFGIGTLFTVPATRAFSDAALTLAYLRIRAHTSSGRAPSGS